MRLFRTFVTLAALLLFGLLVHRLAAQPVQEQPKEVVQNQSRDAFADLKRRLRKAVVGIAVKTTCSAYGPVGSWQGTGFVCDLKTGLVITNHHVSGWGNVASYEILCANGQKLEARLLYVDPWHDFAFLRIVEPAMLPKDTESFDSFAMPRKGESVLMVGSNQGRSFSVQEGFITNLYQGVGFLPEPAFSVAVNSRGGSSGSPLVNKRGQVVGLNYAGDNRLGFALHPRLLEEARRRLLRGKTPRRFHVGAVLRLVSMDKATKFWGLPQKAAEHFLKRFPDADARLLMVVGCLKGSPAEGVLRHGDVVWAVSGREIGPSLEEFEEMLAATRGRSVVLSIYRKGRFMRLSVPTYDLHDLTVKRLFVFGGAVLFQADDQMRWQFGVKPNQVMVRHVTKVSAFGRGLIPSGSLGSEVEFQSSERLCALGFRPLDYWIKHSSSWIERGHFIMPVRWLTGVPTFYSGLSLHRKARDFCPISYVSSENPSPKILDFNPKTGLWDKLTLRCSG